MKTYRPFSPSRRRDAFAARSFVAAVGVVGIVFGFDVSSAFGQYAPVAPDAPRPRAAAPVALGRLSIAELQEIALRNNPALAVADRAADAERGVFVQVGLRPNPTLRFEAEEVGAESSAGKQGFVVEREFGDAKRRRLAQETSARALEKLEREREIALLKIRNDVRAASYRLLIAQKKVDFRRQIADVSQRTEDRARESLGAGETSELNVIQLRNQTRQARLALAQEENAQTAAKKRLLALIGLPEIEFAGVADDVETLGGGEILDENATLDDVLERSPEIERRRAAIREKQAALAFEQTPKTTFSLEGGVCYDFGDRSTLASAGIGIPLRVEDRNQGNVRRAAAELAASQRELERTRLKLRAEFADVFAVYRSAREEVDAYRQEILLDLDRFYAMSRQAFDCGEINFLELSAARVAYVEGSVAYLDALERLADSLVKIEGALLENSLESGD